MEIILFTILLVNTFVHQNG